MRIARASVVLLSFAGISAGVIWLAGCGGVRKAEPVVEEKNVPAGQVQRGEVVFMRYCNQCHPGGAGGLGPALNNKPLPGVAIKDQVRIGGGAMPAFHKDQISEAQLTDLVAYMHWLRGLKNVRGS